MTKRAWLGATRFGRHSDRPKRATICSPSRLLPKWNKLFHWEKMDNQSEISISMRSIKLCVYAIYYLPDLHHRVAHLFCSLSLSGFHRRVLFGFCSQRRKSHHWRFSRPIQVTNFSMLGPERKRNEKKGKKRKGRKFSRSRLLSFRCSYRNLFVVVVVHRLTDLLANNLGCNLLADDRFGYVCFYVSANCCCCKSW